MGQVDVYELLKRIRLSGDDTYYTVKEIEFFMKDTGHTNGTIKNVRANLWQLEVCGYLEIEMSGNYRNWRRMFRYKIKETDK